MLAGMPAPDTVNDPADHPADADRSVDADAPRSTARGTRRTLLLAAVIALLVIGLIVTVALTRTAPPGAATADTPPLLSQDAPADNAPLPDMTLPPLGDLGPADGIDMAAPPGEPVVVNFWASWCAPCVEEMPMLQRVADDLGIRMIGVDYIDLQPDKAIALADELGITYPLVRDEDGAFGQATGLIGTPTTLLVDGDGLVRRRLTGALTEEQLRAAIADNLGSG
ncbi:hypothetical protein BH23ACT10_BH23ACT10_09410 [soil metagenome]